MAASSPAGRARSSTEMRFAISLAACRQCRTRVDPERLVLRGHGEAWAWNGSCGRCASPLSFTFRSVGDPVNAPVPVDELGGARPSEIIRPGEFVAEIDRLMPLVRPEASKLGLVAWKASRDANDRLLTCLLELAKFLPAGRETIDPSALSPAERADQAARPERYRRAWIVDLQRRHRELRERIVADLPRIEAASAARPAPHGTLDGAALRAHEAWVRRGQTGAGRLVLRGGPAIHDRIGAAELTGAVLETVELGGVDLSYATLDHAELSDAGLAQANLTSIGLRHARISGGTFARAALALAKLEHARVEGTLFNGADLDRSQWQDARVTEATFERARFGNAALDRAVFLRCNLRGADLSPTTRLPAPSTVGARFEDCDLRDTRWQGRELAGASFVRCRMAGLLGRPASVDGIVIEEPDLSRDGDGSDLASREDVLALWGAT